MYLFDLVEVSGSAYLHRILSDGLLGWISSSKTEINVSVWRFFRSCCGQGIV